MKKIIKMIKEVKIMFYENMKAYFDIHGWRFLKTYFSTRIKKNAPGLDLDLEGTPTGIVVI